MFENYSFWWKSLLFSKIDKDTFWNTKNNLIKLKFYKSTMNINEYMEIYVDFKVNWLKNNLLSEYHLINVIF